MKASLVSPPRHSLRRRLQNELRCKKKSERSHHLAFPPRMIGVRAGEYMVSERRQPDGPWCDIGASQSVIVNWRQPD